MAQVEVAALINSRLFERRRSSETDHVNRIRTANSKRQSMPLWGKVKTDRSSTNLKQNIKGNRRKSFHDKCASSESSEDLAETKIQNIKGAFKISSKTSLGSVKDRTHKQTTSGVKVSTRQSKSRKKAEKKPDIKKSKSKDLLKKADNLNPAKGTGRINTKRSKPSVSHTKKESMTSTKPPISKTRKRSENLIKAPVSKTRKKSQNLTKPPASQKRKSKNLSKPLVPQTKSGSRILEKKSNSQSYANTKALSSQNLYVHNRRYDEGWTDELIGPRRAFNSKDLVILNWLHELNCPKAEKIRMAESSLGMEKIETYPIRILKKPIKIGMNESLSEKKITRKSKITSKRTPRRIISAPAKVKNVKKKKVPSNTLRRSERSRKYQEDSEEMTLDKSNTSSEERSENDDTIVDKRSKQFEPKVGRSSSKESDKGFDVEMRLSERGELQISLNVNSFRPDDTAVVIWLDDLKSEMKPNVRKRLHLSPITEKSSASGSKHTEKGIKSQSALELEDIASPRPNIYFPSVTVLKNLAVDSKAGLKDLNEDNLNSIYYKRCNLNHVDAE